MTDIPPNHASHPTTTAGERVVRPQGRGVLRARLFVCHHAVLTEKTMDRRLFIASAVAAPLFTGARADGADPESPKKGLFVPAG